jgi:hypothetical protein
MLSNPARRSVKSITKQFRLTCRIQDQERVTYVSSAWEALSPDRGVSRSFAHPIKGLKEVPVIKKKR